MNKIKLISIALILFLSIGVVAQSRNNTNLNAAATTTTSAPGTVSVINQSPKLRTAIGWKIDQLGNWISNENAISDTKLNVQSVSTVPQNFKWLQFVALEVNKQTLYALLYENQSYVSPIYVERRVNYFIMTEASYASLVECVDKKKGETLTIHSSLYGYMSDNEGVFTKNKLIENIKQTVAANTSIQYDFSINAQYVDGSNVVRFRLPEVMTAVGNSNMVDSYFETSYNEFKSCLLPVPKVTVAVAAINIASAVPAEFDLNTSTPSSMDAIQNAQSDFSLDDRSTTVASSSNQTPVVTTLNEGSIDGIEARSVKEKATVSEPIAELKNIKGWYNNEEGEWVSDDSPSYRFETVGKYEIRSMSYKQKQYFIFIKYEKYTGSSFYLVTKEDYLDQMKEIVGQSIIRLPYICGYSSGYTLAEFVEQAESIIDAPKAEQIIIRTNNLVIQYKVSKTKNIARFFIFGEACTQYGINGNKTCDTQTSSKIKYDDAPLLTSEALFTKMYYETTYDAFNTFLQAPLTTIVDTTNASDGKTTITKSSDGWDDRN